MRTPLHIMILSSLVLLAACGSTGTAASKSELKDRARAGDAAAQYQLGQRYADSATGRAEAIYWLCSAAKQGYVPSQMALATLYEEDYRAGEYGAPKDGRLSARGSAFYWYTAAASQGSEQALDRRSRLAAGMAADEVAATKRRAARWQQAVCVEP